MDTKEQAEERLMEAAEKLLDKRFFNQSVSVDMQSGMARVQTEMSHGDWQDLSGIARSRTDTIKSQAERIAYLESRVMELKEEVRKARLT